MTADPTADRLYDAECALHNAHQTHLDEWITAASDRLHMALAAYVDAHPLPCVVPTVLRDETRVDVPAPVPCRLDIHALRRCETYTWANREVHMWVTPHVFDVPTLREVRTLREALDITATHPEGEPA